MTVGHNVPRKEGFEKLAGSAKYVDDIRIDGMLYGKTIRSTVPRGRIKNITLDPAFDWSRIVVADYRDIPGENYVALIENDQPLLAETEVRHCDEPVLLIAAETKPDLGQAARHIKIEYETLPPVLSIDESLKADTLISGSDNVFKRFLIGRGDLTEGFADADLIVEGEYTVPHQEQLYIEPQGMIAIPEDGKMTVMGSMQCPYYIHKAIKQLFRLSDENAVVIQTTTGGSFATGPV
jgi:CO/xanthine dehydrogenase Mo-binding subunit